MTQTQTFEAGRGEIEDLLPWFSTGRLSADDMARVETALAGNAGLRRQLDLIREEMAETIHGAENSGVPTGRAFDKLMAAIDAEPRKISILVNVKNGIVGRFSELLAGMAPRQLAYASIAAVAVLAIQSAALTGLVIGGSPAGVIYGTASSPRNVEGPTVLIGFAPDARAADIMEFLRRYNATIIDGPRANGFFKLLIGEAVPKAPTQNKPGVDKLVEAMNAERPLVVFAGVAE